MTMHLISVLIRPYDAGSFMPWLHAILIMICWDAMSETTDKFNPFNAFAFLKFPDAQSTAGLPKFQI